MTENAVFKRANGELEDEIFGLRTELAKLQVNNSGLEDAVRHYEFDR